MSIAPTPIAAEHSTNTLADLLFDLGDIPLNRVVANPAPGTATEKDLLSYCDRTGLSCELIDGTLVIKSMGYTESVLAVILGQWINNYLDTNPLGACAGAVGPCALLPGLTRLPDVSFIISERLAQAEDLTFAPGAPDLCVEVISKSNTRREISRKIKEYFRHGARLVWVFDIREKVAEVYLGPADPTLLQPADTVDGRDVLPGFQFVLGDLFALTEKRVARVFPAGDRESPRDQKQS